MEESHKEFLAGEFLSLILPRMLNQFSENMLFFITNEGVEGKSEPTTESQKKGAALLEEKREDLKTILSQDFYDKLTQRLVPYFCDALTEDELRAAIDHEKLTIKISNIASNLDVLFQEVLGEVKTQK